MKEDTSAFPWVFAINILLLCIGFLLILVKSKNKENLAILLGTLIAIINIINEGIKFAENQKSIAKDEEYKTFVKGTSEVPALTGSVLPVFDSLGKQISNRIVFALTNVDGLFSLKDVRVKFMEGEMKNVGNLNPKSYTDLFQIEAPAKDTDYCYIVIWYSTGKCEVDFKFTKDKFGAPSVTSTYLDANRKEFVPMWQKRAKQHDLEKDSSIQHYDPTLFQPSK